MLNQLCKITLRGCGARLGQMRIFTVRHPTDESIGTGIQHYVQSFTLTFIQRVLGVFNPEPRLAHYSIE